MVKKMVKMVKIVKMVKMVKMVIYPARQRDYAGSICLLEFNRTARDEKQLLWLSYCAFHLGEYQKALDTYDELMKKLECKRSCTCTKRVTFTRC